MIRLFRKHIREQHFPWFAAAYYIGLAGIILVIAFVTWQSTTQAKDALCVLKADLQTRVDQGHRFLSTHPNGIPGIPASVLRQSVRNQEATLSALNTLDC